MEQIELVAKKRDVLGKKVRFLRKSGITPVHVFGHKVESLSLQCETADLKKALTLAGRTRIINLQIDKTKKPRTVMLREMQKDAINGELLHVDLYQVSADEKVKVQVPISFYGEAPALKSKDNLLEHALTSLTLECLPANIPDRIKVDISVLVEDNSTVRIKDIKLGEGVALLYEPERIIVKIGKRYAERPEVAAVAAEGVPAEGEAAAEGAAPAAEGGKEPAKGAAAAAKPEAKKEGGKPAKG